MNAAQPTATGWLGKWRTRLARRGSMLSSKQEEAAARLATVLLCGEQSAIAIFSAEIRRRSDEAHGASLSLLRSIERDEHVHEQCLKTLCEHLPLPDDAHAMKRRAQRFFAALGRVDDMARHFGRISHLDSAVCKIMWHLEHSEVPADSPLGLLARQIKQDEARHVAVSRRHAQTLGLDPGERSAVGEVVRAELAIMLEPLGPSFETIGVDTDRLMAGINRRRLP